MKKYVILMIFIFTIITNASADIQNSIDTGLNWLLTKQNEDGSFGYQSEILFRDTEEVLNTLYIFNQKGSQYQSGLQWSLNTKANSIDFIARKIILLSDEGIDTTVGINILLENQNTDGGWGISPVHESDVLDTALALQALMATDYSDMNVINSALGYLLSIQNPDGGWGFYQGDGSNVYMTAVVSMTLQQFPQTTSYATAINKATAYLIAHHNIDKGFGLSTVLGSTVYETALAYIALVGVITDNTVLGNAVNYLISAQSPDGSWLQDTYNTALALRALYLAENKPPPQPKPIIGTVTGQVVDASTNQPLSGVSVVLQSDTGINAVTDSTGGFSLSNIPPGSYVINFNLTGYTKSSITVDITEGSIVSLGTIPLSIEPTTGIIKGIVTDAENGQPLEGVHITATGSFSGSTLTGIDGNFIFTNVPPGGVTLTASKTGYYPATGTGTVVSGGILFFNPQLSTQPPPTTLGNLTGKVFDGLLNKPIQGATISLSGGLSTSTDAQGVFIIEDIIQNKYQLTVSAPGYISQIYQIMISSGVTTDMQKIFLIPILQTTTITGKVTDAITDNPIEMANVVVVGTSIYTKTDNDGTYTISGLTQASLDLRASAIGYDCLTYQIEVNMPGVFTVNFELMPSIISSLKITDLITDKQTYSIDSDVTITATIENSDSNPINAQVIVHISDSTDNVIAILHGEPETTFYPSVSTPVTIDWNTGQFPSGYYNIRVKIIKPSSIFYDGGTNDVLSERTTYINILPVSKIDGAMSLSPPVTQADMLTPVSIKATIRNTGNTVISSMIQLEVKYEEQLIYSQNRQINNLPINNIIEFDFGSFEANQGGIYSLILTPVDNSVSGSITTTYYVGPHANANFTVIPDKAPPGDVNVKATIKTTGGGANNGMVINPLLPLIRESTQKAINWEQQRAFNYNCNACHVQSQILASLELSRNKVQIDNTVADGLFNAFKSWQKTNGAFSADGIKSGHNSVTTLALWALSYWHNTDEAALHITKAADFMTTTQQINGAWRADLNKSWYSHMWWCSPGFTNSASFAAYNAIGIAKAYSIEQKLSYKDSLMGVVGFFNYPEYYQTSIGIASHTIMGLTAALTVIDDQPLINSSKQTINNALNMILDSQNQDGGWGEYPGDLSDPLYTAFALYSINISGKANENYGVIEKASIYLLNSQQPDGSWDSRYVYTNIPVTSWVTIALPVTFGVVDGIKANLILSPSTDVTINSASIKYENLGADYLWQFGNLTQEGVILSLNMTVSNLQLNEERKIANEAYISFLNVYTNETVTIPVEIPVVRGDYGIRMNLSTDKTEYKHNTDVKIETLIYNESYQPWEGILNIAIDDLSGVRVADVATINIADLEPWGLKDWSYRIPVSVVAPEKIVNTIASTNINFTSALQQLGASGTFDSDSIRVMEVDESGYIFDEKYFQFRPANDYDAQTNAQAELWWLIDGDTQMSQERYFYIYFDIVENGIKDRSSNNKIPNAGIIIAYIDNYHRLLTLKGDSYGSFGVPVAHYITSYSHLTDYYGRAMALSDFNNDGYQDIVVGYYNVRDLYFLQNRADGSDNFLPRTYLDTVYSTRPDATTNDFDNDGNIDLVLNDTYRHYLFKGYGDGTFQKILIGGNPWDCQYYFWYCGAWYYQKSSSDINSDGNIDLVIGNSNRRSAGGIYLFRGNGDGTFMSRIKIRSLGRPVKGLAADDFDGDGYTDIIVNEYFIKNNGNGTYAQPLLIDSLISHYAFDSGDFNLDGNIDLLAAVSGTSLIKLYYGNGDGTFSDGVDIETFSLIESMSVNITKPEIYVDHGEPEKFKGKRFEFIWNTGKTIAGNYKVQANLYRSGTLIDKAVVDFVILPAKTLSSKVNTDKISYSANQTVTVTSTLTNLSPNYIFENLSAKLMVIDAVGQTLYTDVRNIPILTLGQVSELKTYWNTSTNPKGTYTIKLEVFEGSTIVSSSTTTFEILGSANTGEGLIGTITAQPDPVYQGKDVTVTYTVENNGNEDIIDLNVKVLIVDPNTQLVKNISEKTISLPMNTVATGSSMFSTSDLTPDIYLAVLQVITPLMNEPKTISNTTFEVIPGLEVTKTIPDAKNVLVWLNYSWQSGQNCPDRSLIENALQDVGVNYFIVIDKKDFEAELRNPYYTDFLILGDHHPIEDHFSEELREQIYSGKGLISSMFNRQNLDEDLFGIQFSGHIPGRDYPVELLESEIATQGNFQSYGRTLNVDALNPDEIIGWVVETTKKGITRYPAVIRHDYGLGKVLFYAFDLGLSSFNYSQFRDLLNNSLHYIHAPMETTTAFKPNYLIPVELKIRSFGGAFDLRITETYPSDIKLYDPLNVKWITDNPWIIDLHLEPHETETVLYYALTPDVQGTYTLQTEIGYIDNGTYNFYQDLSIDILIDREATTMTGDIITALNELSLTGKDSSKVRIAKKYIENVLRRFIVSDKDIEKNIHDILKATGSLLSVSSTDVSGIRLMMAELLMVYEGNWYFE